MVMQLNDSSAASLDEALHQRRIDRGVGGDEAEHRRHVRMDHAGALADAGDGDRAGRRARRCSDAALGTVSVVMIASAASAQPSGRASASAAGSAASMRSCGSVSMITPVENGSTCSGRQPSSRPSAAQVERARARPSAPVPALALPVLTRIARTSPPAAEMLAAQLHRRGAEAVRREDAGDRRRRARASTTVRSRRFGLADAGHGGAEGEAGDGVEVGAVSGADEIDCHGDSVDCVECAIVASGGSSVTTMPFSGLSQVAVCNVGSARARLVRIVHRLASAKPARHRYRERHVHSFIDLVDATDEARREFETNPVVLDIVANGLSDRAISKSASRAVPRGLALQSDLRSRGQPSRTTSIATFATSSTTT